MLVWLCGIVKLQKAIFKWSVNVTNKITAEHLSLFHQYYKSKMKKVLVIQPFKLKYIVDGNMI